MKKLAVVLLGMLLLAGMIPALALAHMAQRDVSDDGSGVLRATAGEFRPAAALDTIWYGFLPSGGAHTMSYVGQGGVWNFDIDSTGALIGDPGPGTTSGSGATLNWQASAKGRTALQGWTPALSEVQIQAFDPDASLCEPDTYLNYGNKRAFWGQKNMTTVADRTGGFTNTNISGTGSLWCGVDQPEASNIFNEFDGDEGIQCAVNFPGYADLWDQLVWKDVAIAAGGTTMTFSYKVDMDNQSEAGDALAGCAGSPPMQNGSVTDRLDVYVGIPTAGTPTSNYELTDLISSATQLTDGAHGMGNGYNGLASGTVTTPTFGGGNLGIGSSGRIVFRVRTNRSNSDQKGVVSYDGGATSFAGSNFGAAVLDDIYFSNASGKTGGVLDGASADGHNFAARYTFDANSQGWAASAKVLPTWVHIINVGNNDPSVNGLGYDVNDPENKWADPCGWPGKATATCNIVNNGMAGFNPIIEAGHRDHYATNYWPVCCPRGETCQGAISPDIDISAVTLSAPRNGAVWNYDDYAYNPLDDAVLYQEFIRYKTTPAQPCPNYSSWKWHNTQYYTPSPACSNLLVPEASILPVSSTLNFQMFLSQVTFCWELGTGGASGTCSANFTPVFDNIRIGLVNSTIAPALTIDPWEFYQDSYPQDEYPNDNAGGPKGSTNGYWAMQKRFGTGTLRKDNAAYLKTISVADSSIDRKTAVICENLNKASGPLVSFNDGYYQGDSMNVRCSLSASGTRVDFLFQVIPGPKTNTNDIWFTEWKACTGMFGTGSQGNTAFNAAKEGTGKHLGEGGYDASYFGKHGAGTPADAWRWYVWNDARMDTTERDTYDASATLTSVKKSTTTFMTTLHEDDPHYLVLGVNHELPLVNAASPFQWLNEHSGIFTQEHTPILPSYLFTPGTVINYILRACFTSSPTLAQNPVLSPDTTALQSIGGNTYHLRVLPNAWNDTRYGANTYTGVTGQGRACVLFIDHSFGQSLAHFPYVRSMDSLGIIADEYLCQATSSSTGSFGGSALDLATGHTWQNYGSSGLSTQQMSGYNAVFVNTAGINSTPLSDATVNDPSADTQLLQAWLDGATSSSHRLLWLSGNNVAQWMDVYQPDASPANTFRDRLGIAANTTDDNSTLLNYRNITGDNTECPTISGVGGPWSSGGQKIGVIFNFCLLNYDMLAPNTGVGAYSAQQWPVASPTGPNHIQSAAVVRENAPGGVGSRAVAVTNGFDFSRVRNVSCHDSYGRIYQMRTIYYTLGVGVSGGNFCTHNYAQTAVDPGFGRSFTTALYQNAPNPFRPNRSTTIRYAVGRTSQVSLNIIDVSGRVVRSLVNSKLIPGDYSAHFDGRNSDGRELAAGVYFYRLKVGDFESNKKMLMLK